MRFAKIAFTLLILSALPAAASAAEVAAVSPAPVAPHQAYAVSPHRALYRINLASAKSGSSVTSVSGTMMFELSDVCDGWAEQQRLQLRFTYSEGDEAEVVTNSLAWESKDGKRYNFNVRRLANGEETEIYRGKAVFGEKGMSVKYESPSGKTVSVPDGAVFPMSHTSMILAKAMKGEEKFFSSLVFDGTDEEGMSEITTFIGLRVSDRKAPENIKGLKDASVLARPSWPVRLAFFNLKEKGGEPDYEMDMMMQDDGIATDLHMDYGDFSVHGTLVGFSSLPRPGC